MLRSPGGSRVVEAVGQTGYKRAPGEITLADGETQTMSTSASAF